MSLENQKVPKNPLKNFRKIQMNTKNSVKKDRQKSDQNIRCFETKSPSKQISNSQVQFRPNSSTSFHSNRFTPVNPQTKGVQSPVLSTEQSIELTQNLNLDRPSTANLHHSPSHDFDFHTHKQEVERLQSINQKLESDIQTIIARLDVKTEGDSDLPYLNADLKIKQARREFEKQIEHLNWRLEESQKQCIQLGNIQDDQKSLQFKYNEMLEDQNNLKNSSVHLDIFNKVKSENSSLKQKKSEIMDNNSEYHKENLELKLKVDALTNEIIKLKADYSREKKLIRNTQTRELKEKDQKISLLREDTERITYNLLDSQRKVNELTEDINNINLDLERCETKLKKSEEERISVNEAQSNQILELNKEVSELKSENANLKHSIQDSNLKKDEIIKTKEKIIAMKNTELQIQCSEVEKRDTKISEIIEANKQELGSLNSNLRGKLSLINDYEQSLAKKDETISKREEYINSRDHYISEMIDTHKKESNNYQNTIQELKNKLQELESKTQSVIPKKQPDSENETKQISDNDSNIIEESKNESM